MNKTLNGIWCAIAVAAAICASGRTASAQTLQPQERLCDPTYQDCRADLLTYIAQETVEIDVGAWMFTDARYTNALVAAWQRGVKVRVLMDPRCQAEHPACVTQQQQLQDAGIPMRNRLGSGILHWKCMIFASQGQIEFSGANYAPFEFVPATPWVNYTDEIIYYTNNSALVQSFMSKFDDLWTSTTEFADFANVNGPLTRSYPTYPIDPELNFPPDDSYRNRAIAAYDRESQQIDVQMFRITDQQHSLAMIRAINRGVPVRLITDETEYRNPDRLWDAYNVDMMYNAGVQVRLDAHQGIDHAKGVILHSQGLSIFGSSNWTSPSSDTQREHNYFTVQPWIFQWMTDTFNRKWTNGSGHTETKSFVPLPPDAPAYNAPASGATAVPTSGVTLSWNGGLWAHLYDIYFGTTANPPLLAANVQLGPSQYSSDYKTYALPTLQPGTTYYWKIVSKTMAYVPANGVVWSFTTAGSSGGGGSTLPSGWSNADVGATGAAGTSSYASNTFTVTGAGADVWGTSDAFQYAYTTMSGDGSVIARVATEQNVSAWTKAGVMIRGSLSPSSAQAFMLVSPGKGTAFQRRLSDNSSSVSTSGTFAAAPRWVKLSRSGNTISAYESADGTTWNSVGSNTFSMPSTVYVGLAVSSHVSGTTATATFDSVSTGGSAPPPPPPTLPSGWSSRDVGATGATGTSSYSNNTFTIAGAGADVWGTSDAFQYAYTTMAGDGTIVARVATEQYISNWTKAGVMIRGSLSASSAHAFMLVSPGKGTAFQRRVADNNSSVNTAGTFAAAPRWVKLSRSGNTITAYESANGSTWNTVGSDTFSLPSTVYIGLAVSSHVAGTTATATFDSVTIGTGAPPPPPPPPPPPTLPDGWSDADVGSVPLQGSASYSNGTYSVTGSGADIWGTADAFNFANAQVTGDATIVARVTNVEYADKWTKAGVMIRETLTPGSTHALMLVSPGKGLAFQRRPVAEGESVSTAGSLNAAPRWVKLTRSGDRFEAFESGDGATWTVVGSDTIPMATTVHIGLAVTSHTTSTSATATFDNVVIDQAG